MCASSYTVGPQAYHVRQPSSDTGSSASEPSLSSVLRMRTVLWWRAAAALLPRTLPHALSALNPRRTAPRLHSATALQVTLRNNMACARRASCPPQRNKPAPRGAHRTTLTPAMVPARSTGSTQWRAQAQPPRTTPRNYCQQPRLRAAKQVTWLRHRIIQNVTTAFHTAAQHTARLLSIGLSGSEPGAC